MRVERTERGSQALAHEGYPPSIGEQWLAYQSSAIDPSYPDALGRPGSSYLWVGDRHHLDRDQVRQLVAHLQHWLETGSLELEPAEAAAHAPDEG